MRKRHNQNSVSPTYNLDDEVNVREYPYYRTIPVKCIGERQQRMRLQYNSIPLLPSPDTHHNIPYEQFPPLPNQYTYDEQYQEHQNNQMNQENQYDEHIESPLPVFNLVPPSPGENVYRVDMQTMEKKLEDMHRDIDTNVEKLADQERAIAINNEAIQKQIETIQNYVLYIQQQNQVYNHNAGVVQQQVHTYQINSSQIMSQQETLGTLQNQIIEYEEKLEQLKQETELSQQQMAYHGSMLNAFSTMMQNPQYFTYLMSMSLNSMPPNV